MNPEPHPPVRADWAGWAPSEPIRLALPRFISRVPAGFPSPADDYVEQMLDLNEYCVRNAPATFYLRVRDDGDSMIEAGIFPGDLLCVDRSLAAQDGDFVIAAVNGEFTLKELVLGRGNPVLRPHNAAYEPIVCADGSELEIFGVVTGVIRKLPRGRKKRG